jgi:signal transduction histidine kinase
MLCGSCGKEIAVTVTEINSELANIPTIPPGSPRIPEVLVPRLGEYLIEKGVLDSDGLEKALAYQKRLHESGQNLLIGQVLVELNLLDRPTLDEAITERIIDLQKALQEAIQKLERQVEERTFELQNALIKLAQLNQLKSNFVSNISHELRTPLTHLKGYLDMLSQGNLGILNQQQLDALFVLQKAERRLENLIEDLIQFSLATRGELNLEIESFDLRELISSIISRSKQNAATNRITVNTILPNNLPPVIADKEKLDWVITQLLTNAIKFTPSGRVIEVSAHLEDGVVIVKVKDHGIGISNDRLSEIFEPFHQLDGSITRHFPGLGLGLALVKKILDAHGIQIIVRSKLGEGSEFSFALPCENQQIG